MKKHLTVISLYLVVAILLVIGAAHFSPKENWKLVDMVYFKGVEPDFKDSFMVQLKREYIDLYYSGELTVEDFKYDNIERISQENVPYPYNDMIIVHLKNSGTKQVKLAILHCMDLWFVETAVYRPLQWLM